MSDDIETMYDKANGIKSVISCLTSRIDYLNKDEYKSLYTTTMKYFNNIDKTNPSQADVYYIYCLTRQMNTCQNKTLLQNLYNEGRK